MPPTLIYMVEGDLIKALLCARTIQSTFNTLVSALLKSAIWLNG